MTVEGRIRLLCVDDEKSVLDGLMRTLRNFYAVEPALGGIQGLDILKTKGPFAIVMSDLHMPYMSGIEFLSAARRIAPESVRVLLTGHADLNDAIAAVNDGNVFRFLLKPCPTDVLLKSLAACTEQYRLVAFERALRNQVEGRFYKAFNASPEPISIATLFNARFLDVNESFLCVTGFRREEVIGHTPVELQFWKPEEQAEFARRLQKNESLRDLEIPFRTKSGERRVGLHSAEIIEIGEQRCSLNIMKDVTEQRALEKQLRQTQKMEAIGKLSGGIAHDFNNLLGVILGYGDVLGDQLVDDPESRKKVEEITKAARRAAELTRQLLAFSRQQMLEPTVLNLNAVVADLQKMLQRLIGEDIELNTTFEPSLTHIKADQGQIGQVIMNLVVNARDAMPEGGKIMIETANAELDERYARQHPPAQPGPYVLLTVTDTGVGMDADTQAHIFEPFFTTKELGKGTGLGLATVYGVVKQCGGYIWVYSELGHGTTFKIYLPQVAEPVRSEATLARPVSSARRSETILLVEDEDALRTLVHTLLSESGYSVLVADGPARAMELARHHSGPIHLLLSDVVMPGISGPELAEKLRSLRSEMMVLFMSGYPRNAVVRRGLLKSDARVLLKPFTRDVLFQRVREALEPETASRPS